MQSKCLPSDISYPSKKHQQQNSEKIPQGWMKNLGRYVKCSEGINFRMSKIVQLFMLFLCRRFIQTFLKDLGFGKICNLLVFMEVTF